MALAPDLQAQETEVTTAVINAIKNSKEYCQPIQSTPYGGNVIETCKLAGQAAMMFKQQLQGARLSSISPLLPPFGRLVRAFRSDSPPRRPALVNFLLVYNSNILLNYLLCEALACRAPSSSPRNF